MPKKSEIYKCDLCGNIIEVLTGANGALICCGQDMKPQKENTVDAAIEKHIPVVSVIDEGLLVTVGSVNHPMTEEHLIEWIEVIASDTTYTTFLKAGDKPQACFPSITGGYLVRAYCNLHGLWKA